ncbi:oocyte zinc finger -like [Pelobates cultripes]|uniref:Oocyte zinc finger -like n=2 Tax=Pelobates cultripes TaxID=61616 RepID=A0AAD1T8S1_PELCU|nr:oocyte zinc finger -like [Pelobates cultripes]
MNMDWDEISEKILGLTLRIICLITGEDQMVAKKLCECVNHNSSHNVTEGSSRTQSPSKVNPRSSLIRERKNNKKILELTNQIIHLLTGEVPLRCEDVTVYFSMEEWEYLEGHKDLYKDVMMENHQTLSSPDKPSPTEYHTPDCVPDFGNNEESVKKPSNGANYVLTSKVRKMQIKNVPYKSEESPPCIEENHRHMDIYKQTEYQSSDINKESALHEEGNLTGFEIHACTDNTQTEYSSIVIKEESATYEQGRRPGVDLYKFSHNSTLADNEDNRTCSNIHSIKPCIELNTPYHIDGNVPRRDNIFLISDCPQGVSSDTQDVKHQSTHTGEYLLSTPDLVIHEMNPTGENQISSSQSGSDFIQVSNLVRQEMDWNERKPFKCSECGKYFTQAAQLASHKMVHNKEKPYKCTECSKTFRRKTHLVSHQKIHTGEKPFKCTECGKCFALKHHLISHHMVHTGKKPFKCSECGKGFTHATNLTSHKLIHTGEKPFSCSECGKRFNLKHVLSRHHRVHTGEKPYRCLECGKSFARLSSLVSHKRTHTGDRPLKCS